MVSKRTPMREASAGRTPVGHIRVGSYYEIDHSILPRTSPEQLKAVRVVLVSKITATDVCLRYPSASSAALDECHAVPLDLAADLLYRRIAPHELSTSSAFCLSPVGKCSSELRSGGMVQWGKRLRVRYQSRPKEEPILVYGRKSSRKFIDRWCVERYKLAESNMLKVMKEKNAVFGNPILRPVLRSEARKLIGDTGLLDHLLKHMAGKVAPGGHERFRRKHNAHGAMEYWLEASDLLHLRTQAGVQDPYWMPPPGWKLGDCPTQDPVCAAQIRHITQGLASLRRDMDQLTSNKQEEDLTTPISCVTRQNDDLITPAKQIYAHLLKKKHKIEDQLLLVAQTLRQMEEDMGWLQKTVDEDFPNMPLLLGDSPTMNKENQITVLPQSREKGNKDDRPPLSLLNKTGFRICRPVGSFSWPRMPALAASTDIDTQLASSPCHPPSFFSPPCPLRPLAAKRPLALPFPFALTSPEPHTNLFL